MENRSSFGAARDGRPVERVTLRRGGLEAEIITFGAALTALRVPAADGMGWAVAAVKAERSTSTGGGSAAPLTSQPAEKAAHRAVSTRAAPSKPEIFRIFPLLSVAGRVGVWYNESRIMSLAATGGSISDIV